MLNVYTIEANGMTTPDHTFAENEGFNRGKREALRQLLIGTAQEALRRYMQHPTTIGYQNAIDGAVGLQMSVIHAGGGVDLLPIIRESCAHLWLSPLAYARTHICQQCGEIEPVT